MKIIDVVNAFVSASPKSVKCGDLAYDAEAGTLKSYNFIVGTTGARIALNSEMPYRPDGKKSVTTMRHINLTKRQADHMGLPRTWIRF